MKNEIFFRLYNSILISLIILCSLFYYTSMIIIQDNIDNISNDNDYVFSYNDFFWPLPGYHRISSHFGPRKSPTTGASSNHSGIDIPAPENTIIHSVLTCKVISTSFSGAGGYTIVTESNEYRISYCHVSPNFIVVPRSNC